MPANTPISVCVCDVMGADGIARLAEALGVDPLDVSTHAVDPVRMDGARLLATDLTGQEPECIARMVAAGFRFFFRATPRA